MLIASDRSNGLREAYSQAPASQVKLYGTHATRPVGFCDMLLSGRILSSREVVEFLPRVQKHRGATSHPNRTISFSLGLVSFKYAKRSCNYRHLFRGGLGVFAPIGHLLAMGPWRFSHCSSAGGIGEKELNAQNIVSAIHHARAAAELLDDGFGNVFELVLDPVVSGSSEIYPRVVLDRSLTIAVPTSRRLALEWMLKRRQEAWRADAQTVNKWTGNTSLKTRLGLSSWCSKQHLLECITPYLQPFTWDAYNVLWYEEENLEDALYVYSLSAGV